ncbi:rifamycin-inactivating phosphotransferase [Nocardiopsis baichengensis]|uniref:rifamycin-inactivating phosphotransferase n=1 Tax=Nocardiopsis baichengensis TaxID=280240 RepID=UPI000348D7EE|nr:rifamycin-inactivating phosphotransferase [Nocardiopsis baichengensis]
MLETNGGTEESVRHDSYVLDLREAGRDRIADVGGKGAHLGELSRIDGVSVPDGYCVTTAAFRRVVAGVPEIGGLLDRLAAAAPGDRDEIRTLSAQVRRAIEECPVPDDLAAAVTRPLARLGEDAAYAVRSSATAEDLPAASFAGQQDTYLNVVGPASVLEHVRLCWASLFTERATAYRLQNGFDHRKAAMAVLVQRMVASEASGTLFTADPVTGNRRVSAVESVFGLGEALVSGRVNADVHRVRDGAVVGKEVAAKRSALDPVPGGGTRERPIGGDEQERQVLTDEQAVRLAELGRRIEAYFGRPQDIEWCLADGGFRIVQSRPVTTLFPVPEARGGDGDGARGNRVYISVGHQQMMTDPLKPLGLSFWQMTTPRPMAEAGGRLFVDVTAALAAPASRAAYLEVFDRSDPLIGDALRTVLDRGGLIPPAEDGAAPAAPPSGGAPGEVDADPAVVAELVARGRESTAAAERAVGAASGPELFDVIVEDLAELKRLMFDPHSTRVIMAAMEASAWLNDKLSAWLGEQNAAEALTQSAPGNVTSQMGLALLDVADAVRPHPEVVAHLRTVGDAGAEDLLEGLTGLPGGRQARDAIQAYLDDYGMRCVGEIDITRPRWSERPATLVPVLLSHIDNFEPGAGARRFEQGLQEARKKEREVLERLRALPDGEGRAEEVERRIGLVRTFIGYREYPKYFMISRYLVYKRALLAEADGLVRAGVLRDREDAFFLTFEEFRDAVRTGWADDGLIRRRREEFTGFEALTPPRVLTSEGEAVTGSYRRRDVPDGALAGLPVSSGTVEGHARVVLDMEEADLEAGDILVTAFTDPSWSPLFVTLEGLVTEVGGMMTHGAVVAREYGLPAVVGVENATALIRDGQRIRVNGTDGHVEILS